jgi:hypothetical protein
LNYSSFQAALSILTSKKQQLAGLEANLAELKRQLDAQMAIQA